MPWRLSIVSTKFAASSSDAKVPVSSHAKVLLGVGGRRAENAYKAVSVEDVVPQDHGPRFPVQELLTQNKGLSQAVQGRLNTVEGADADLWPVTEQCLGTAVCRLVSR